MTKAIQRIPRTTVRARNGVKILSHGLRLGWRITDGADHPVTTRYTTPRPARTAYRRAA